MNSENNKLRIIFEDEINIDNKLVLHTEKNELNVTKPFLKWVGGKTQIIHKVLSLFPIEINNYREIFLGGGSVLLAFLSYVEYGTIKVHGKVYAYDINNALIHTYKNIQIDYLSLYREIEKLNKTFLSFPIDGCVNRNPQSINEVESRESFYYWLRKEYNSTSNKELVISSAKFIFLNKSCFRGLFREGPNGFNVPYGNYKNINIVDLQHLERVSKLIKNVSFECLSFTDSMKNIETGDFIYLDPPYVGENEKSFVNYTKTGFSIDSHTCLFNLLKNTDKKFLMSNSKTTLIEENFPKNNYTIETINCKRSINSKDPSQKTEEVLVRNY